MYESGLGTIRDDHEAFDWYFAAAVQGLPESQNKVGYFFETGTGVPRDEVQAAKWYRKAAEQGYAVSQLNLAMLYATGPGQGVSVDRVEAYRWLILAAASGSEGSGEALRHLRNVMTRRQLREARLLAYGWRSRPVPDLAQESLFARTSVALSDTAIEP
jgi:hypothetical protein